MKITPLHLIRHLGWMPGKDLKLRSTPKAAPGSVATEDGVYPRMTKAKIAISAIFGLLAVVHIFWPGIGIDFTTLVFLVVGVLPWIGPIIRSVELPGGFKIELQDVKAATDRITAKEPVKAQAEPAEHEDKGDVEYLRNVATVDPNLALVGMRIEIERRLSELAERLDIASDRRRSARMLVRDIVGALGGIDRETVAGLNDLISLGNRAAHGADVSADAATWSLDAAPQILRILDNLIVRASEGKAPANTRPS